MIMDKIGRLLRIIIVSAILAGVPYAAFGQNEDGVVSRPVIEYSSADLRDPFEDLLQMAAEREKREKELRNKEAPEESSEVEVPMPSLDKLKVQGVMWGGKFPQVVINGKVLAVGDAIEGFKIVSIEKKGITLDFSGRTAVLSAPGSNPVSGKGNKDDKEEK